MTSSRSLRAAPLEANQPRSLWRRVLGMPARPRAIWGLVRVHADGSGETPLYWCRDGRTARRLAVTPTFRAAGRVTVVSRTVSAHIEDPERVVDRLNRDARPNLDALLRASLGPRRREKRRWRGEQSSRGSLPLL